MASSGFGPIHEAKAHVRFGTTGGGHAPNYQIESAAGAKYCFRGMGHEAASEVDDAFAEKNLSDERFSYAQVQAMLASLIETHKQ
ncbi:hypothetical protein [Qipengyuania atrilutea]|uniref:Uncharacterized protein n=1 Tax=Qipengyuania atrilutea TaxID=2744473 RepID=A0A850HFI0_9SPHN|nr:hypothetical protein [Actirhodobacter atriluteus]NVD46129.1 hypothetical protein [Actirhodobacter atriluteus]